MIQALPRSQAAMAILGGRNQQSEEALRPWEGSPKVTTTSGGKHEPAAALPMQSAHPQHFRQPQSLRLPSIEDRFHNVGRQAGERQEPADVGVCDILLLREIGDRLRAAVLDLPPPPVRPDE
jgi:hypothetical protein